MQQWIEASWMSVLVRVGDSTVDQLNTDGPILRRPAPTIYRACCNFLAYGGAAEKQEELGSGPKADGPVVGGEGVRDRRNHS